MPAHAVDTACEHGVQCPHTGAPQAMLLGGASALTGFEADTGLPLDPPPSTRQGFGRVLLKDTLPLNVRRAETGHMQ